MNSRSSPATRPERDEPLMRLATAAAVGCGLWALVAGELLEPWAAALGGLAYAGALAAHGWSIGVRRMLSPVAVLCGLVLTPFAPDLGHICGILVTAVAVGHAFTGTSGRDRRVALAPPVLMLILTAGVAPGPAIAAPFLTGWLCLLVAAVSAHAGPGGAAQVDAVVGRFVQAQYARRGLAAPEGHSHIVLARHHTGVRGLAVGRYSTAVTVAFIAALVTFLILPHPDAGARHKRVRDAMTRGSTQPGAPARSEQGYLGDRLDMRSRGSLSQTPLASVPNDSPRLWRSGTVDLYDGVSWRDTGADSLVRAPVGHRVEAGIFGIDAASTLTTSRTDRVIAQQPGPFLLISPGVPQKFTGADDLMLRGSTGVVLPSDGLRATYAVTSAAVVDPPLQATPSTQLGDRWLQLPATVTPRTRALAHRLTDGASSPQAAIDAVHDYVQTSETYDLESPVPARGVDAVDDFLFISKRGFCEQFAAAAVVLLREAGIPARMAVGFGGGVEQGSDRRILRASDLHAWVEAYVPGAGWVSSDPTAAVGERAKTSSSLLAKLKHALATRRGRLIVAAVLLALTGLGGLIAFGVRRWRRSRCRAADLPPLLAAYARFEAALARRELARSTGESLSELRTRVGRVTDVGDALETLQCELYGNPGTVSDGDRAAAVSQLDRSAVALAESPPARRS